MAQHWVPQYVLRGFSVDDKTIWQYDKTGQTAATKVGIRGACGRNDAFSPQVERLLSTIENAANPAIHVFRRMERAMRIEPVVKRIVAVYLQTFLWKRSPGIRDQQVAETKEGDLLGQAHDIARLLGVPRRLYQNLLPTVAAKVANDVNGLMAGHWESGTFQRWLFYSMSWVVLRCTEPIVTVPDRGLVRLGGRGLLDPKAEFYFPLSSKRVLMASWCGTPPGVVQLLSASPALLRSINKHGFAQAGRFVYGRSYSEKVAKMVKRPSHQFPTLKALEVAGGPNPTLAKLDGLKAWYANVVDDDSDDPDRCWCMGPGAGSRCRHEWQRAPFDLPVMAETPEVRASASVCKWCGALELRYPNGHVRFDDLELRRTTANEAIRNWWQSFRVVGTDTRIKALGSTPRYYIAG